MTAAQDLIAGICKDKYDQDGVWADIDNWNPAEMKEFMDEIKQLQEDAEKWRKQEKDRLDTWDQLGVMIKEKRIREAGDEHDQFS